MAVAVFRPYDIDVNPPLTGLPFGAFVGDDTALTTLDGDGSYVQITASDTQLDTHTWRMAQVSGPPVGTPPEGFGPWATFVFGWSSVATLGPPGFEIPTAAGFNVTAGGFTPASSSLTSAETTGAYFTRVQVPNLSDGAKAAIIDPDSVWAINSNVGGAGGDPHITSRLTYFAMEIPVDDTATWLRVRKRDDGLGMGAPRVRKVSSQQRSPRVRGYR